MGPAGNEIVSYGSRDAPGPGRGLPGERSRRRPALRAKGRGYPAAMDRIEHMEHLDKHLVDELAQVARDAVREELREQTLKQRRTASLYAASGAVALYAGAALALTVGLVLALGLPDWVAALITAVLLGAGAYALRNAARPTAPKPAPTQAAEGHTAAEERTAAGQTAAARAAEEQSARVAAGTAPGTPPGGLAGPSAPPVPPVAPGGVSAAPGPSGAGTRPVPGATDPEGPHHPAR